MSPSVTDIAKHLPDIVKQAGELILTFYTDDIEARMKDGGSPVTDADEKAEAFIIGKLQNLAPDIPIVAEESVEKDGLPDGPLTTFFLVDPLDGTKEFISRNGEFTVNIALIENGRPVAGTINVPAKGDTYWTLGDGKAYLETGGTILEITSIPAPADGLTVVASRSHRDPKTEELLEPLNVKELKAAGSSLKLCLVAKGEANMYPRTGRTMEWDIAAGHAILAAAGGKVLRLDNGTPLTYGKDGYDNPHFLALGRGEPADYGLKL